VKENRPLFKQTAIAVLVANVALLATGCAKGVMPTTATAVANTGGVATIMTAGGKEFGLGFDDARYKVVEKKTKVQKLPKQGLLPTRIDLAEQCSPVANQGKIGSCTAFATGKGFREFQAIKRKERVSDLSAMFLYYEARARWGNTQAPTGSTISDNISVLKGKGMCTEATMPYDVTKYMIAPTVAQYAEAQEFKFLGAVRISTLDDVQVSLSNGEAVPFAFDVMESFRTIGPPAERL
jgi:C1A family cysteine protease